MNEKEFKIHNLKSSYEQQLELVLSNILLQNLFIWSI